jgi:hypothetical protein
MIIAIPENEKLFIDKSLPDRLVKTGIFTTLSQSDVFENRKIIIRANEVTIDGNIIYPSGHIEIYARKIISNSATIDISGNKGNPDFTNRAQALSGTNPGDSGSNGENGGNGKNGGTIRIIAEDVIGKVKIFSNGGTGGKAQDGGNGSKGKRGRDYTNNCEPPTNGGSGGTAGQAGKPGDGGNGGEISIFIANISNIEFNKVEATAAKGRSGEKGRHGKPGQGGDPGKGGVVIGHWADPCLP